jgi:hypothetical protein
MPNTTAPVDQFAGDFRRRNATHNRAQLGPRVPQQSCMIDQIEAEWGKRIGL